MLIHPANSEPFGMVVCEARNHGLPVLISDAVGAGELDFLQTTIVPLNASVSEWCEAAEKLFARAVYRGECRWTWADLVEQHRKEIYPRLESITL